MFWEWWRSRASQGDSHATWLVWSILDGAVKRRDLSEDQWHLLSAAISAIAQNEANSQTALNRALRLGRRPGRRPPYQVEETRRTLAQAVFDLVGDAAGGVLEKACERVAMEHRVGFTDTPTLKGIKAAYREYLPYMLQMERLSREDDNPGRPPVD